MPKKKDKVKKEVLVDKNIESEEVIEKEKSDSLEIAKKAIVKKYGSVITTLKEHEDMNIQTISSGSISLDLALGRGGFAMGRVYEIFGPNSGGKTTLAVSAVIEAQNKGMKCCFIDAEHAVDPVLFKNYGVNVDDLIIVQGYDGEGNLDILENLIRSGGIDVAVVDSVSSLIPRMEVERDVDQDTMAALARLMSKALRRLVPLANRTNTLLIFINQLRMKIGSYGSPAITTGGEALGFYSTGRISVRGPEAIKRRIVDKVIGEVIGHISEFEVVKNKLAPPFRKASIKLIYGEGYDKYNEVLDIALSFGVVDKTGSWYKYKDENLAHGEDKVVEYLKDNEKIYNEIRNAVLDQVGLTKLYE